MRLLSLLLAVPLLSLSCSSQDAPPPAPASAPADGKVIFSRSLDQPDAPTPPRAASEKGTSHLTITDDDRAAPVFTAYDLDVHLTPAQASLAVQARITLRNGGADPLHVLPLQLSSTLHIERVLVAGAPLPLTRQLLPSDADHTGQLEETAVALPRPLAPGATLQLTVEYSGPIPQTAARLDRLEVPAMVAAQSDWDQIGQAFTGLRGFGDTVWYPVCSLPALLGDGARLFAEIGRQRARNQDATITIRLTDEFTGVPPSIAVLAGHPILPGPPQQAPNASFPGVLRLTLAPTRLGFRTPALFLADRAVSAPGPLVRIYSTPEHSADTQGYSTAATLVEPLLSQWLGSRLHPPLSLLDLPVAGAQPSEQGDAALLSLIAADPRQIAPFLAQELAHSFFHSPRVWLDEGVPALLSALYTEQTQGRAAALEKLAASRAALAFIEPASPGQAAGQDLLHASDPIYYRAKALDVLWMLRDLAGDKALLTAFRAYDPAADTQPDYFEKLLEQASSKDLEWFFDAWVYHDLGLPDLSIVDVYPSRTGQSDQWLVTIDIANDGYAETEVPVTVHSATTAVTERVRVPARNKASRRILIAGEPVSVDVNDGTVPEVQASVHQRLLESR